MQFVHQALIWGFLLALLPLLIHLINMMRHRRVQWAAMEFLLKSYRKNKKWVWLKQLLLLLMRMAAVALIVGMLAQWVTRGQWLDLIGGKVTHHYVILDDSFSMSDRVGGTSAFENGLGVIQRIASNAAQQDTPQRFTLVRFSHARAADEGSDGELMADLNAADVDAEFDLVLREKCDSFEITQLSVGPQEALETVTQLMEEAGDENRIVYVVSDFRNNQWENPAEARRALSELNGADADIRLISCARTVRPNLAVVGLQPTQDTRAAGVPLFVNVQVRNYAAEVATKIQLKLRSGYYDPDAVLTGSLDELRPEWEDLPTVLIDRIEPGETVTRRVQVYFAKAGQHVVQAQLPDDPVASDNQRWCVVDFPEGEAVLVVDGSLGQRHQYYLTSVFQPGPRANTGIRPDIQQPNFLRDSQLSDLRKYSAIYLLDVGRLDESAVKNLEGYLEQGGGVAFFLGDNINYGYYNQQLYRDGEGLFPLPVASDAFLAPTVEEKSTPDIVVTDHPIFRVFLGERNPLIRRVLVERHVVPPEGWTPPEQSTVTIAAELRNRSPLAVESQFGNGRVVVFLTSLAPDWNNWAPDPSFVVMLLKLQSYLASGQRIEEDRPLAAPIDVQLASEAYNKDVKFVAPGENEADRIEIDRLAVKPQADSPLMIASLGRSLVQGSRETDRAGIYEAVLSSSEGKPEVRRYAANVDPLEGDLTLVDPSALLTKLDLDRLEFRHANEYQYGDVEQAGFNRSLLLMCLLIGLLLGEQILAFSASYHPPRGAAR